MPSSQPDTKKVPESHIKYTTPYGAQYLRTTIDIQPWKKNTVEYAGTTTMYGNNSDRPCCDFSHDRNSNNGDEKVKKEKNQTSAKTLSKRRAQFGHACQIGEDSRKPPLFSGGSDTGVVPNEGTHQEPTSLTEVVACPPSHEQLCMVKKFFNYSLTKLLTTLLKIL